MKLMRILFRPQAELKFTHTELALMMTLSVSHYDGVCKSAGREGGFLYGMNNRYDMAEADALYHDDPDRVTHKLYFNEIDTLCKILEVVPMESQKIPAMQLSHFLHNVCQQLNIFSNLEAPETEHYKVSWI